MWVVNERRIKQGYLDTSDDLYSHFEVALSVLSVDDTVIEFAIFRSSVLWSVLTTLKYEEQDERQSDLE